MENKRCGNLTTILVIVIFMTNITQMPQMIGSGINSKITLLIWGGLSLFIIIKKMFALGGDGVKIIRYASVIILYSLVAGIFTGYNYLNSTMIYPMMLTTFVFIVGYSCSMNRKYIDMNSLYLSYIFSSLIVAFAVYFDSFRGGFNWTSRVYAYASKNSVSQILLTAIVLLIFSKMRFKLFRVCIAGAITMLLLMLKSRASLIGLIIIVAYILMSREVKKVYKTLVIVGALIVVYYLNHSPEFYNIFINGIVLGGRDTSSIDSISSGRYGMLFEFWELFKKHFLLGTGAYYLESFPLSVLCQFGVLGIIPIGLFIYTPIKISKRLPYGTDKTILQLILFCYYANGLFEELSPLGPGVKCYMLWFLLGIEANDYYLNEGVYEN